MPDSWIHEIIVVDNASTDRTATIVRTEFPSIRLISEDRKGLPYARQAGLNAATGDLYAAIDADSRITPVWLKKVKRTFAAHPDISGMSGYYWYDDLPRWQTFAIRAIQWLQYFFVRTIAPFVNMTAGGNSIYNIKALRSIGGFNTKVVFFGEGMDTMLRLKRIGTFIFSPTLLLLSSGRRLRAEGWISSMIFYKFAALKGSFVREPRERRIMEIDYR